MSADTTMADIPATEPKVEQPAATEAVAETTPAVTEEKKTEEKVEEKPAAPAKPAHQKAVKFDASLLPESDDPEEIRKQVCSRYIKW